MVVIIILFAAKPAVLQHTSKNNAVFITNINNVMETNIPKNLGTRKRLGRS